MKDFLIDLISNTIFLTVISGVLVFVISKIIIECMINPSKNIEN